MQMIEAGKVVIFPYRTHFVHIQIFPYGSHFVHILILLQYSSLTEKYTVLPFLEYCNCSALLFSIFIKMSIDKYFFTINNSGRAISKSNREWCKALFPWRAYADLKEGSCDSAWANSCHGKMWATLLPELLIFLDNPKTET